MPAKRKPTGRRRAGAMDKPPPSSDCATNSGARPIAFRRRGVYYCLRRAKTGLGVGPVSARRAVCDRLADCGLRQAARGRGNRRVIGILSRVGGGRHRRGGGRRRVLRRRARARANDARSARHRRRGAYPYAHPHAYSRRRSRRARRRPRKPQRAGRAGRAGLPTAGQRQRIRRPASVLALRSQSPARPHAYADPHAYAYPHGNAHAYPYAHARRRPRLPCDRPGKPQPARRPRRNGMPDARQRRRARRRRPLPLRRAGDRYAYANPHAYAYADPHGDAYANSYSHADADSNARPRNPRNGPLAPRPPSGGRLAHRDAHSYA